MTRILHHLKFDLLALRVPLLIWYGFVALSAIHWGYVADLFKTGDSGDAIFQQLPFAVSGFAMLFAAFVVQRDPAAGTRAFWLTRPFRGFELLAAKTLSVGLFVALPLALHYVVIAIGRNAPALAALRDYSTIWLPFVVTGGALGAITSTLPRFFALTAAAAVAVSLLILYAYGSLWHAPLRRGALLGIQQFLILAIAVTAFVHQYLTRRTWWSFALLASFVVLFPLAKNMAPLSRVPAALTYKETGEPPSIAVDSAKVTEPKSHLDASGRRTQSMSVLADLKLNGVPRGAVAEPDFRYAWLSVVPDGTGFYGNTFGHWQIAALPPARHLDAIAECLESAEIRSPHEKRVDKNTLRNVNVASVNGHQVNALEGKSADISVQTRLLALGFEIVGRLPREESAEWKDHRGRRVRIAEVEATSRIVDAGEGVRSRKTGWVINFQFQWFAWATANPDAFTRRVLDRKDALIPVLYHAPSKRLLIPTGKQFYGRLDTVLPLKAEDWSFTFEEDPALPAGNYPDWLAETEIVLLEIRPLGIVESTLEIPSVQFPE